PVREPGLGLLLDRAPVGRRDHRPGRHPPRAGARPLRRRQRPRSHAELRRLPDVRDMAPESVLVANRGEIAARVLRACRELGIRGIAVHTAGDTAHLALADTVVEVPSYLDGAAIVAAAQSAGAAAIHPGYGFLSENADFARAVAAAGFVFVGPDADVIELMGRKDRARDVAERAGVPVTPRFDPEDVPADAYPVLVKAAAGGGGKGMHVVRRAEDLSTALATAAREARSAFGDDTLLIERYVEGGRHVEVQVFGDRQGHVVHLFERDCSAQ